MTYDILYFSHPICGVCQALKPKIKSILLEKYPNVSFREIRIDEEKELAARHFAFIAPVLLLMADQKEVARLAGVMSLYQIESILERNVLTSIR